MSQITAEHLRSYIQRIENLEVTKAEVAADIKDVYAEAKGNGYDTKAMRQVIKLRKMAAHERDEQEYLIETYKRAIGLLPHDDEGE